MIPPWSPTILATNARPRPLPVGLVVTNGSNKCGIRSSGTPGPLSRTQNSSGSDTRALEPGPASRTPGRQPHALLGPRHGEPAARPERRGELDLAVGRLADRFGRVLH